ncbi:MAG: radical SAM/SPASM domain-containing protein [Myxococcota bacterium]
MGIIEVGAIQATTMKIPRLDFELSAGCDHRCAHCYNVWNAEDGDPQAGYSPGRPLSTDALLVLMTKAVKQSGCTHLTLTGGEPLLHRDAMAVIEHATQLVPSVNLITNGSHVDAERAEALARFGLKSAQLTLLSPEREQHDELKGAVCFDDTVRAAFHLQRAGVAVQICFVAMAANADRFQEVLELCAVLGLKNVSYNRMSPTGGAVHHIERLMPTIEQVEANLRVANDLAPQLGISVGTAMPIPPCLVRMEDYPNVRFGFCSTGTQAPNIVVDPVGNVRSCNLASGLLGNLVEQDWADIMANPYPRDFRKQVPEMCRGCAYERSCNGGCKESSFATFGDHTHPDPFVWLALDPAARGQLPRTQEA